MKKSLIYRSISSDAKHLLHDIAPQKRWRIGFFLALTAFLSGVFYTISTIWFGIGEWGLDRTVGWGWAIVNFVWWIGIGHAGTFISAILLLFNQRWRHSISRIAESMTIFAILCAAFFPVIHLGRVLLAYFIIPYPNTRNLWVNFNSPLLWDVFAITTYFTISLLFWYIGMIPDLAILRDQEGKRKRKKLYKILSFGWLGSLKQWARHEKLMLVMAGLATPLVISVHSIVSMDFATSIVPGWHSTIFPPYFVAGALLSGFAMVVTLVIVTRETLPVKEYITIRHIEAMNKIILVTGTIVAIAYLTEIFFAFYSGIEYESYMMANRMSGPYAIFYWLMLVFNLVIPQLYWIGKIRRNIKVAFIFAILINVGMWLERFVIVVSSLHRDFIPSNWRNYAPTLTDVALFVGSLGFFFLFFLLFIKYFPVLPWTEIKSDKNRYNNDW